MSPAFKQTTKLLNPISIFFVLFIAIFYLCLIAFTLNFRLVAATLEGQFALQYKISILWDLLTGLFFAFGFLHGVILLVNGILVGFNLLLILKTIQTLEGMGKVKLSIGGATLISIVTAGCGACGITIFSVLGLSTSLSFLPLHGLEIHIASFLILSFSAWYMVKKLTAANICSLY